MNRRSGLGKGLGSLIPTDASTDQSGDLLEIPISAISANEYQPRTRFEEEALVSLTDSIRALGVLQPILVREVGPSRYELIAGERRWRAARRAGLPSIPAVVREADDRQSLEQAVVENLHREDLNALEEAAAYQQLIDEFKLTQDDVASRVGKSRSAIANTLRLFQLPGSVQKLVASSELSAGHARALLASPDRVFQEQLAKTIVADGLNVRQVESLVRASNGHEDVDETPTPGRPRRESGDVGAVKPASLLELEERLGEQLETRVNVSMNRNKGRISIEFADLDDLERIYKLISVG